MASPAEIRGGILVVDDEEAIGQLLSQWLAEEGFETQWAAGFDGVREALDRGGVDVVTLDIMMPGMSGLGILGWLRRNHPDVSVVMATALDDLDTVLEAMRQGAVGYLVKPFNLELVTEDVMRVMERRRLEAENRRFEAELAARVAEQTRQLRQTYERLHQQVRQLEARDRMVRAQLTGGTPEQTCRTAAVALQHGLAATRVEIWHPDPEGRCLEPACAAGTESTAQPVALDTDDPRARVFGSLLPEVSVAEAIVPLVCREEVLGVVRVTGDALPEAEVVTSLAREAALLIWSGLVARQLDAAPIDRLDDLARLE